MSAVEDLSQERRITFCLYEYWEKLAGESGLPALKNMNRNEIAPFKKNLVLLDLRNGQDNPTFQVIGQDLLEDLDDDLTNKPVSSVPRRTMLSRVTDHYMEVLANRVPIAFEAEFVNKEGEKALYRGILLPFSDDNKNINFILGGVRWILEKDVTLDDTKPTIEELMRQIAQGREDYTPESEQPYDTAASVDEDIPEFAETELNDEILEADVTDAISEPDITAEDEMVIADETYDEDILSEFNADNNAETETAENEDDILALDIEDEDEDEAIAYSEPENETDALDLGNSETDTLDLDSDDYSTELAAEENLEMASLQTPEFEHIAENEDLVFGEDLEEALQSSDLNAEAESDNSHNFEAETTYHEADGHSDKPDSDYQTASPGSLLRKIFIPMDEQTEINISDLDDDDELMLSASENTEEQEDVTESGHHEDNLSSFSALVDAIQNGEEDSETSQDDLTEAEIREDEIAQWPFDNEDHQNPDHLETQDADNSVSEDLQQSVDLENPAEESLLNTVNDEEAQAIERNDLQQGDFDNDEFEDILELTEMAEEEVVSDDSGEPSFSADFDENEEITDFLDVEDTVPFEEDLINELTSVEQIDEKPKTLESLLAEDSTAEELNIESSEELNKSEDADNPEMEQHDESVSSSEDDDGADHGLDYEANADIGSDSEISEPEDISTEENLVEEKLDEDTSDHEEEDLVLTIEEGLHSSFDTAPLDSHEDEFKTDAPEMEQQDEFVVSSEDDDSHDHDLDYEATADIGSDSEISEPEDIITEKIIAEENLVEDTSDHEAEDLVLTTEDDLHSTVDTAPLDSREDNDSAYDDDLSIEELMQSIIAERKFDQAYIREQALREDQEQNEELTKDGQTEETVKASESLTEGTESDYNPDADSPEEDLISISDTKDEILREDQAGLDFVSEYESLFDEYPAAAEIDTPAPNEETDRTSDATVTPETSSEDLEADNQEINVLDDNAYTDNTLSESDQNPLEANEITTVQPYETDPANLVSATAPMVLSETKAEKPKRRGSVIERAMEMMSPRTIKAKSDTEVAEQVLGKIESLENIEPAPVVNVDPIDAPQEYDSKYSHELKTDDDLDDTPAVTFEELRGTEEDSDKSGVSDEPSELEGQIDAPEMDFVEPPSEEPEYQSIKEEFSHDFEEDEPDTDLTEETDPTDELETTPVIEDHIDSLENAEPEIESPEPEETPGQTLPQLRETLKQVVGYIKKEDANHNRSRDSLYNILTAIYEFYDICEKSGDAFDTIVQENDLKIQSRAPYTPVLKICLGKDYDKTRLTEYAAALGIGHYMNVDVSEFHAFIKNFPGGIKGCVKEMRNIRKHGASGNITARKTRTVEEAREILRDMAPIASFRLKKIIVGNNVDEFCLLLAKRDGHDINVLKVLDDKYTKLEPILKRAAFIKGNLNDRK